MATVWLVCEKIEPDLIPIGIFSTTQVALNKLSTGTYVGIPVTVDHLYGTTIVYEGMQGAKTHVAQATAVSDQLETVISTLTNLNNLVRDTMIPEVDQRLGALETGLAELTGRVAELEGY